MFRFLFGVIIGMLLLPGAVYVVFWFGKVPVAVADPPFPRERQLTSVPLHARIQREMIGASPIQPAEANFVAGARIYTERCSVCHGLHGKPSAFGADMYPSAPQLLEKHHNSNVVGVSDDPTGETYWKVYNGIRLTGMPSFNDQLSETEMWQVSMFLSYADKPMPPAALQVLHNAPAPPTGKHTQPAPPEEAAPAPTHTPASEGTPEAAEEPQQ
jgi:mono/diheme cytochrome c family protein